MRRDRKLQAVLSERPYFLAPPRLRETHTEGVPPGMPPAVCNAARKNLRNGILHML